MPNFNFIITFSTISCKKTMGEGNMFIDKQGKEF